MHVWGGGGGGYSATLTAAAPPAGLACARAVAANLSRSTLYLSGQSCGFIKHVRYSVFFGVRIL